MSKEKSIHNNPSLLTRYGSYTSLFQDSVTKDYTGNKHCSFSCEWDYSPQKVLLDLFLLVIYFCLGFDACLDPGTSERMPHEHHSWIQPFVYFYHRLYHFSWMSSAPSQFWSRFLSFELFPNTCYLSDMTQINLLSKQSSLLNARFCFQHTALHEWAYKRYTDSSCLCWWSKADIQAILEEVQTVHFPGMLSWPPAEHRSWNYSVLCPVALD